MELEELHGLIASLRQENNALKTDLQEIKNRNRNLTCVHNGKRYGIGEGYQSGGGYRNSGDCTTQPTKNTCSLRSNTDGLYASWSSVRGSTYCGGGGG